MKNFATVIFISFLVVLFSVGPTSSQSWIDELSQILDQKHLTEIDKTALAERLRKAVNRELKQIDPYASYTSSRDRKNQSDGARYEGIGADIFED